MPESARHSKVFSGWGTPEEYIEAAREVLGTIDLDPASDIESQRRVKATRYFTKEDDGLRQSWDDAKTIFLNPPGGQVRAFWRRLIDWSAEDSSRSVVWIGYSLEQLQTLQTDGPGPVDTGDVLCFPSRRIPFYGVDGVIQTSPTHANYILYMGNNPAKFRQVFRIFGEIL